jgi:hypothetical protein
MPENIRTLIQKQADFIVSQQLPSGAIPWYRGGVTDPWDHVECAMALDLAGRRSEADLAYEWMRGTQNPDGSWYFSYINDGPEDLTKDTNFSTYIATGAWLHYLVTRDTAFLRRMWASVDKAIDFALSLQQPGGEVYWGLSKNNEVWPGAILTACCSAWLSIGYGTRIARELGMDRPDWDRACGRLGKTIKEHPERFDMLGEDKSGHAMTWYYPVLAGLLEGKEAQDRISKGWSGFIVDGWGCKCFADRQSVCVAETCELVMALARMGDRGKAKTVMDWVLRFRDSDGVFYREVCWPQGEMRRSERGPRVHERNTWTSAAAILAIAALDGARIP